MINAVKDHAGDLDAAAQLIAREALDRGSDDNLTTLVVRVDALPSRTPTKFTGSSPSCRSRRSSCRA